MYSIHWRYSTNNSDQNIWRWQNFNFCERTRPILMLTVLSPFYNTGLLHKKQYSCLFIFLSVSVLCHLYFWGYMVTHTMSIQLPCHLKHSVDNLNKSVIDFRLTLYNHNEIFLVLNAFITVRSNLSAKQENLNSEVYCYISLSKLNHSQYVSSDTAVSYITKIRFVRKFYTWQFVFGLWEVIASVTLYK
jgi:hypothetical protein